MALLPFLNFSPLLTTLISQLQQNANATVDALNERVVARVAQVTRYAATGATTTKIPVPARNGYTAYAVMLVKVSATNDPGTDIPATGRLNFTQPNASTLNVFEPADLTSNVLYDLTYLIFEQGGA